MPPGLKQMPSTLIGKRDYGIKIAMKGYDVRYAADNNLLYNSSFPVLGIVNFFTRDTKWEVVASGSYQEWNTMNGTVTTKWQYKIRIPHGLDYPPAVVRLDTSSQIVRLYWDNKYIYASSSFFAEADYNTYINNGAIPPTVVVLSVNIDNDVEYPYLDDGLPVEWGQAYDYGLKHILAGEPNTATANEMGLNANVQSMMVVAVKIATAEDRDTCVYIPDGISPSQLSPFCFVMRADGTWAQGGISVQAVSGYQPAIPAMGRNYYVLDGQWFASKCSLVLVRLPMIAPDKTDYTINM